jgi:hypothetical protein
MKLPKGKQTFTFVYKKQIWVKTNLEKETNPHANRNRKYFYTLCTSAKQWGRRRWVTQGPVSAKE